ncbi:hypothetical protein H4219_002747 [Mycoemilia scoparia]|uniref:Oxidoreductase n=1 Tax=Mycoemilia scoparia TaxID=417184 RepID=A0A9W8DUC4_9FUNG|nr:hypothetical protein H4219_002747 [Mycoemilia scoparia]
MTENTRLINVGVVGYGMSSQVFHCPLITSCKRMKLHSVVERHNNRSTETYPNVNVVRSFDELIAIKEVELVVIATANDTHVPYTEKALRAGKHCVVEKPFTETEHEANELTRLAKEKGLVLSVFHNRRWDGDFLTVTDIVRSETLGNLVEFESRFDRFRTYKKPNAWREVSSFPGSGILYDLGSHLFDQALVLFGEPESIYAELRNERQIPDGSDDSFLAILSYPKKNLRVVCRAGMIVKSAPPRFSLFGTKGAFIKYGLDVQESQLKSGLTPARSSDVFGHDDTNNFGTLDIVVGDQDKKEVVKTQVGKYSAFYENIADAIQGLGELEVKPEQAAKVIKLIELATKSNSQKRVVSYNGETA